MESDRTSDADKNKNILDPPDNNPERSATSSNPDNNKEIVDSAAGIQDVPMTTGESDKGVGGPDVNGNVMSVCSDIVKTFFSLTQDKLQVRVSPSMPEKSDQHVEESKRDLSISFILGSDREKVKSDPGEGPSYPTQNRFLNAMLDKPTNSSEQKSDLVDDVINGILLTGSPAPTNDIRPLHVQRAMHLFDHSIARSSAKGNQEQAVSNPISTNTDIKLRSAKDSNVSFPRKRARAVSNPISTSTDSELNLVKDSNVRSPTKRAQAVSDPISTGTDWESADAYLMWLKRREAEMKAKFKIETGIFPPRPPPPPKGVVVCDPRFPTPSLDRMHKLAMIGENIPDDIRRAANMECRWLYLIQRLERKKEKALTELQLKQKMLQAIDNTLQVLTAPVRVQSDDIRTVKVNDGKTSGLPEPTVQQGNSNVPDEFNPFDHQYPQPPYENPALQKYCDVDFMTGANYPSPPSLDGSEGEEEGFSESSSQYESQEEFINVTSDDDEAEVDHQSHAVEKSISVKPSDNNSSEIRKYLEGLIEAKKEALRKGDYESPIFKQGLFVLNQMPSDSSAVSTVSSPDQPNHASPVLRKNMPNCHDGKDRPVQKCPSPESFDDDSIIMDMCLEEIEVCDQGSSQESQGGGVKRQGTYTSESPKKRKLPKGAVSPCTEADIPVASLNPYVFSLQEKTTSENEVEGGAKKVGGVNGSDASDPVSPYTKACLSAPSSNPDALNLQKKAPTGNEAEICSTDIGGVKRRRIDIMDSPSKREYLEDPVSPYTKAFISAPPSNADVISLQKTVTNGHGLGVGPMEIGVKRQGFDILESPKKRKQLGDSISPYTKAFISTLPSSADVLSLLKTVAPGYGIEVDPKEIVEVKRQGSDIMESPKKREHPEDPVSPYTKACISAQSSNSDGINLQKKTPIQKEVVVCTKEVGGKIQRSDIMESPKKQKLSDETVSPEVPYVKDGIPASFSNSDFLAWVTGKLFYTPKNLKQLEDEVTKTIARIRGSSLNPGSTLNGQEVEDITKEVGSSSEMENDLKGDPKNPGFETGDDPKSALKYLNDAKSRVEDNLKHLDRLIKLVGENLEGTKYCNEKEADNPTGTTEAGRGTNNNKKGAKNIASNEMVPIRHV